MHGAPEKKFGSAEEEIAFVCKHIREAEDAYKKVNGEFDENDAFTLRKEIVEEYAEYDPSVLLKRNYLISDHDLNQGVAVLSTSHDHTHDVENLLHQHGLKNTLTILKQHFTIHHDRRAKRTLEHMLVTLMSCE